MCIYIYRERDLYVYIYIYIYTQISIIVINHTVLLSLLLTVAAEQALPSSRALHSTRRPRRSGMREIILYEITVYYIVVCYSICIS